MSLGWAITIAGASMVAAGVLAIRMWNDPMRPMDWVSRLGLPPIAPWGFAAIVVGCLLGAIGSRQGIFGNDKPTRSPVVSLLDTPARLVAATVLSPLIAILLFACARGLEWSLARMVVPWLLLAAAVSAGLFLSDRRKGRVLGLGIGRVELVLLGAATLGIFAFYSAICNSWKFSFVGDEFAFFEYSRNMIRDGLLSFSWLDSMGVYNDNPKTMSVYQALWMLVLGQTGLAWKMSAAFLTAICLPPLYLSLRHMVGRVGGPARSAAIVGCIVFFSSEQIILWAVEGKIHAAGLPSVVFSLCLFLAARARSSTLLYWLAGLACGTAFHFSLLGVAVSAPSIGLLIGIDALRRIIRDRRFSLRVLVPSLVFVAGVVVLAAPYLVQMDGIQYAAETKMVRYEGVDSVSARFRGMVIGLLQPLSFNAWNHFLWGNVVDPLSAFLMCMAFFPAVRRRSTGLLQATTILLTCALMTAGLSQYTYPSVTRTFLIMVPVSVLAALGFSAIATLGASLPAVFYRSSAGRRKAVAVGLCLLLGTTVAMFNWIKIWHHNPYQRLQEWQILAIEEIEGASPELSAAVVFPHADPRSYQLELMVEMHRYGDRTLIVLDDPPGLEALAHRLRARGVGKVLVRTDADPDGTIKHLCADLDIPYRVIERDLVTRPRLSPWIESALAAIDRLERQRAEPRPRPRN